MSHTKIPDAVRARVRVSADNRCGYCQSRQRYVLGLLEIEHIIPTAKGGADAEDNLWLARRLCNNAKRAQTLARNPITKRIVRLCDPRRQDWSRHFTWSKDGTIIIGKRPAARYRYGIAIEPTDRCDRATPMGGGRMAPTGP